MSVPQGINELADKIAQLEQENNDLKKESDDLKSKNQQLEKESDDLKMQAEGLSVPEKESTAINQRIAAIDQRIAAIDQRIAANQKDITSIRPARGKCWTLFFSRRGASPKIRPLTSSTTCASASWSWLPSWGCSCIGECAACWRTSSHTSSSVASLLCQQLLPRAGCGAHPKQD